MAKDRLVVAQLVSDFVVGGIERNIRFMAGPMAERGIDFVLISLNDNIDPGPELKAVGTPGYGLSSDWKPIRYPALPPKSVASRLLTAKANHPIQLVHAHHYSAIAAAPMVASRLGVPYLATHHATDERWQTDPGWRMIALRRYMKDAFLNSKKVLCWTQAVVDDVTKICGHVLPQAEIVELPIEDRYFAASNPGAVRDIDVVMVGRLAPQKNVLFALRVFAALRTRRPSLRVVLLGGGPSESAVRTEVASLKLGDSVEVLGNVPPDEVLSTLNRSKIQYMPSLFEGLSAAFIEAMATGLDTVVSDIPSFRAPFKAASGLYFVDPRDLQGNVDTLDQAISAYQFRPRPELRERFNQATYCDRIEATYRSIVAG